MKLILGISGRLGAGKSTVTEILSKQYKIPSFSFGKLIEEILVNKDIESSRQNLQDKGIEIINQIGYSGIANMLLDTNSININTPCIIDGIRHIDVCNFYKNKFGKIFKLIFINSPQEIRFKRIQGTKNKKIVINNIEDFIKIENHSVEINGEKLKEEADVQIDNSGTLEDLVTNILNVRFDRINK